MDKSFGHADVIDYIKNRGNSSIRTYCQLDDPEDDQQELSDPPDLNFDLKNEDYLQWGLKAKKISEKHDVDKSPKFVEYKEKIKSNIYKLKPFLKPAAVAAMILLGISVFFVASPAKAVTLEQLYESIASIRNICITSFVPGKNKPIQKQYISLDENVIILETSNKIMLFDLNKKIRTIKNIEDSSVTQTALPEKMYSKVSKRMQGNFGLLPFNKISDIPPGAKWTQISNKQEQFPKDIEVYELSWPLNQGSSTIYKKWKVYINIHTLLPQKIEFYLKYDSESYYKYEKYLTIQYPSGRKIKSRISTIIEH